MCERAVSTMVEPDVFLFLRADRVVGYEGALLGAPKSRAPRTWVDIVWISSGTLAPLMPAVIMERMPI